MFNAVLSSMELEAGLGDLGLAEPAYTVETSEEVGRHVVTTRALVKGEVVFRDIPLVTGPSRESLPCCIACYDLLDLSDPTQFVLCERCGWPLCSADCAASPAHQPECEILAGAGVRVPAEDTDGLYDVITVLRCLHLKDSNIAAWADLLSLQEADPAQLNEELADRAKKVTALICGTFRLGEKYRKELVFDLCTRLERNSFEIPLGRPGGTVGGVYRLACMMEHCCIPTGHRTFNQDFSITVRAAYGLEQGDSVSLCYTDSLWPTAARRESLIFSKDFLCVCDRCRDPTENGTMLSGLRCTRCQTGYFLPKNPLDCEGVWVCEDCGAEAPPGYPDMAAARVGEAVARLEEAGLTVQACNQFIQTYGRVLHPQHAHMLDIKFSLLNLLGHSEGATLCQLREDQLATKESLANTFLTISSKILPGLSRLKGTALFELYLVLQQRGLRGWAARLLSPPESVQLLHTAGSVLAECVECLQYEPGHQAEGQLAARARAEQAQLAALLQDIQQKMEAQ